MKSTILRSISLKKTMSVIVVFLLVMISVIVWPLGDKSILDQKCSATLEYTEVKSGVVISTNMTVVFNDNSRGYIDVSGKTSQFGQNYILSRIIKFDHAGEGKDIFKLTNLKTIKYASDTTPDALLNSFFVTNQNLLRYMVITKINNSYLISNLHSAVILCVFK
ncbi:TPA: hypothetical protein NPP25_004945 [Klebsiella quasipneumoniae subsp. similipneumoniae]|nr:hypothetical protein [Klebsiella quasipneumoniae subsp. similipneumoniae]HCI4648035.1 hypothetical protein [Klebsiella quasipneumoniae subsp. similipneumoniae]HCI6410325.1 hypothetical protein [Klebsiella quasipneumoniae subsp. similipneumoniae]HCI6655412.1 hypothetical protein [Klebsiella quasipneumoniae subsp. similipneumoniae]